MLKIRIIIGLFVLCTGIVLSAHAGQDTPDYVGSFKDWKVFSFLENDQKGWYAISDPIDVKGSSSRTNSHIYISHRPALNNFNEVSFVIGHNLKKEESVEVSVDGQHFVLIAQGNKAWTKNAIEDQKLVDALLKGTKLILKATLRSNIKLEQTYSLRGSTAAHDLMNKKCPHTH